MNDADIAYNEPEAQQPEAPPPEAPIAQQPEAPIAQQPEVLGGVDPSNFSPSSLDTEDYEASANPDWQPPEVSNPISEFISRSARLGKEAFTHSQAVSEASALVGRGKRTGDPGLYAQGLAMLDDLPSPEFPPESFTDHAISALPGFAGMIFNQETLDLAGRALGTDLKGKVLGFTGDPEQDWKARSNAALYLYDESKGAQMHALMNLVDEKTKAPIILSDEAIDYASSIGASANTLLFGLGGKAVAGITGSALQAVKGAAKESIMGFLESNGVAKIATHLAGEVGTLTAINMGMETSNILTESIAKGINNSTEGSSIPLYETDYLMRDMKRVFLDSVAGALGLVIGTKTAVGITRYPLEAGRASIDRSIQKVKDIQEQFREEARTAAEAKAAAEPPPSPDTFDPEQRLPEAENTARNATVDTLVDMPEVDLERHIERTWLTTSGKDSGISEFEVKTRKEEIRALNDELKGIPEIPDATPPEVLAQTGMEPVPQQEAVVGLRQQLRDASRLQQDLKAAGQKTKDPERAAAIKAVETLRVQVKAKNQELIDKKHDLQMITGPEVLPSEVAKIKGGIALDTVKAEGSRGWIEGEEMTRQGYDTFKDNILKARSAIRTAAASGNAEGVRVGKAQVRRILDEQRQRVQNTAERNTIIKDINTLVKRGSGNTGETDALTNTLFRGFKDLTKLTQEDAHAAKRDQLSSEQAKATSETGVSESERLNDPDTQLTGMQDFVAKEILNMRANVKMMSKSRLQDLHDALQEMFETGNSNRAAEMFPRIKALQETKEGVLSGLLGEDFAARLDEFTRNENKSEIDRVPRSLWGWIRHTMETPGWGAIGAWRQLGKIIFTDPYGKFDASKTGELFETITQETQKKAGLNADSAEILRLITRDFELGDQDPLLFITREMSAEPELMIAGNGEPFMVRNKGSQDEGPLRFTRQERIARASQLLDPGLKRFFMEERGYSQELVDHILDLSPQEKAFQQSMFSFFQRMRDKINPVYSRLFGRELPENAQYFPLIRDVGAVENPLTAFLKDTSQDRYSTAATSGRLKERVAYSDADVVSIGAIQAMQLYTRDMNHFVAWGEKMEQLNTILRDKDITDGIKARFGTVDGGDIVNAIHDHLNVMGRGYLEPVKNNILFHWMRTNVVKASLAGKILVGAKQLNSAMMYGAHEGMTVGDFAKGLAMFERDPKAAVAKMRELSQYIKERGSTDIDQDLASGVARDAPLKWDKDGSKRLAIDKATQWSLGAIHYGDKASIYAGGYALLMHLSKSMPEEAAMRIVERETRNYQQSTEISQMSPMQRDRNNVFSAVATTFSSGQFSVMRRLQDEALNTIRSIDEVNKQANTLSQMKKDGVSEASLAAQLTVLEGAKKNRASVSFQAAKTLVIFHCLQGMAYQLASNLGRWDTKEELIAAGLGEFTAYPILGQVAEALLRKTAGLKSYQGASVIERPLADLMDGATKLLMDSEDEDATKKGLRMTASGAQLFAPVPFKQTFDIIDSLMEEEFGKAFLLGAGAPKGAIDKLFDETSD